MVGRRDPATILSDACSVYGSNNTITISIVRLVTIGHNVNNCLSFASLLAPFVVVLGLSDLIAYVCVINKLQKERHKIK